MSQIVATGVVDIPGIGPVENRNDLLGVDGVDGIKTGTLDEAGSCLLFSADRQIGSQTVTIVGVVLGGPDHDAVDVAVQQILDQAYSGFQEIEVIAEGTELATYATPWGDSAVAVASESATALVWADTAGDGVGGCRIHPPGRRRLGVPANSTWRWGSAPSRCRSCSVAPSTIPGRGGASHTPRSCSDDPCRARPAEPSQCQAVGSEHLGQSAHPEWL